MFSSFFVNCIVSFMYTHTQQFFHLKNLLNIDSVKVKSTKWVILNTHWIRKQLSTKYEQALPTKYERALSTKYEQELWTKYEQALSTKYEYLMSTKYRHLMSTKYEQVLSTKYEQCSLSTKYMRKVFPSEIKGSSQSRLLEKSYKTV